MEMKWLKILMILVTNVGHNYSNPPANVRGNSDGKCMTNLMNGLPNEAFSSSSFKENFYPYQARVIFDKTNSNNSSGLAWCPRMDIGPRSTEWIQVSFDSLKMISNIFTYGRDNGNFGFFAPAYHFDYQRENDSLWHRHKNVDGTTIILGNSDSRNSQVKQFFSNIVAKTVRIIPISETVLTVCLKFSLYGCDFNDGVVEYSIPQGNIFIDSVGQKYGLLDRSYDTAITKPMWVPGTIIHGGIGQIMDNQINSDSIQSTKDDALNFVGWHRNDTKDPIQMVFRFDQTRQIISVRFHVLNNFNDRISIFAQTKFEFSIRGEIFGIRSKDVVVKHDTDNHVMKARWVKVYLNNSIAKYLRISLTFRLDWIVLTEIEFETIPINQASIIEIPKIDVGTPNSALEDENTVDSSSKMNYFITWLGGFVAFILLLIVIIIFILQFRRNRKRRFKGKPNQSILYGNMTCNNVIPIPLAGSNNGGFYKPVPTGVYDCMLPYQSQTMNVRNITNFPNQNNQHMFGTFNNRGNGSTNVNNMINGMNKDNYNAALSPITGPPSFNHNINAHFSENKRASFDSSYAGTGSIPEYSTASINRDSIAGENSFLPIHLINIPTMMYGQLKNPNTDQQTVQIQVRIPHNVPYASENSPLNFPFIHWTEELAEIINKHTRHDVILHSPVGGSMITRQNTVGGEVSSIENYEREICCNLLPIENSEINIQNIVGSGKYGSIYKGLYKGSTVVSKSIDRNCGSYLRVLFLKTVLDLMKLSNKNIGKIIGYISYDNSNFCKDHKDQMLSPSINSIIIEHSYYTDLHTFILLFTKASINDRGNSRIDQNPDSESSSVSNDSYTDNNENVSLLSPSCLIYIASQISNGMSYLEHESLVHRDLAARNCLLGPRLSIIITDVAMDNQQFQEDYISMNEVNNNLVTFGLVSSAVDTELDVKLPLYWMSWEALLKAEYSTKSDVWSFGVVLWEILTNCQFQPYFSVPPNSANMEFISNKNIRCLSLISNFKCLGQSLETALLPNNESLIQTRQSTNWVNPQGLSVPSALTDENHSIVSPITNGIYNVLQSSTNHILNNSREMRDLIESCWMIDPNLRPNFKDINMFLDQKINGFNAEEEYQILQVRLTKKVEEPFDRV